MVAPRSPLSTVVVMTAAVFDVDNTLVKGAASLSAAVALVRSGVIDLGALPRGLFDQVRFRATATEPDVDAVGRRALRAIEGVLAHRIEEVFDQVAHRIVARKTFPGTRALIAAHLAAGDEVWLATAGPAPLARRIAELLGVTGAIGTEVEVIDGRCTGALLTGMLHGQAKADAVAELARDRNWAVEGLTVYSDSTNDLPLLRMVGRPHVVNPDRALRRVARAEGWPVHDTSQRQVVVQATKGAVVAGLVVGGVRALRGR